MKTVPAGQFKAQCLALMEKVRKNREILLITKRGQPVAKLVPVETPVKHFLCRLEGIVRLNGEIESTIESPEAWEALR